MSETLVTLEVRLSVLENRIIELTDKVQTLTEITKARKAEIEAQRFAIDRTLAIVADINDRLTPIIATVKQHLPKLQKLARFL
jgi:hypothetical protein